MRKAITMKLLNDLKEKLGSRKLGVTAAIGAAAGTGAVEVTWPIALVAAAYVLGQAYVDAHAKYNKWPYRALTTCDNPCGCCHARCGLCINQKL